MLSTQSAVSPQFSGQYRIAVTSENTFVTYQAKKALREKLNTLAAGQNIAFSTEPDQNNVEQGFLWNNLAMPRVQDVMQERQDLLVFTEGDATTFNNLIQRQQELRDQNDASMKPAEEKLDRMTKRWFGISGKINKVSTWLGNAAFGISVLWLNFRAVPFQQKEQKLQKQLIDTLNTEFKPLLSNLPKAEQALKSADVNAALEANRFDVRTGTIQAQA